MRLRASCILLVFILAFPAMFYAKSVPDSLSCQDDCFCTTDMTPAGVMISHTHIKGEWMLSYRHMNTNMQNDYAGVLFGVWNGYGMDPLNMRMDMHMLMVMHGLTNKLTLMAMFSYNINVMHMFIWPGSIHTHAMKMQSAGFGDVKLNVLYKLLKKKKHQVFFAVGLNLPTGNINIKGSGDGMYPDHRLPYEMQLGSGTFDAMPGINYLYKGMKLSVGSQMSSVIRAGYNNIGYRFGNEFTFNKWLAYAWDNHFSSSVRLESYVTGSVIRNDPDLYLFTEPSSNPNNYGGKKITAFAGTNFYFRKGKMNGSRIGLEYGIPLYQNLNGIQMTTHSSIFISSSINF